MFWEILEPRRIDVLKKITAHIPEIGMDSSYLAGGTALALQLGHRKSFDFDWFTPEDFDPERLNSCFEKMGKIKDVKLSKGTLHLNFDEVRITWLYYPNPLLNPLLQIEEPVKLKIASIKDIALMKLIAISSKGARRDFIDLYYICREGFTIKELISELPRKFPFSEMNNYHIVKSLTYFEDADRDIMDRVSTSWEDIKSFFSEQSEILLKSFAG